MSYLKAAALFEFEQRQQEVRAAEHLRQEEACGVAVKSAWARFGYYPEASWWSPDLRAVVLEFDGGATRLGRTQGAHPEWRMVFECQSCGGPVLGLREVNDLAEIGRELASGPRPEDFDRHICEPERAREKLGTRKLSDYLGDAVREQEWQL